MELKFKICGLVLASVFATSAIGASAASAAEFHSAVHPQAISATQTTSHVFTTDAGTVTCKKATFSGTTSAKTSSTITMTPDYNECTAFGFINVPIHENGCGFILHANGTIEVECAAGKSIQITAPFCTTTVGAQHIAAGSKTFHVSIGIGRDILGTIHIGKQIKYNECGTNKTNGSYTGSETITGASGEIWYE